MSINTLTLTAVALACMLFISGTMRPGTLFPLPAANAQITVFPGTEPQDQQNATPKAPATAGSISPKGPSPGFSAKDVSDTNSLQTDADIKNLIILIPDKRLTDKNFLPQDATVVKGTKVIWIIGDKNATHGIVVQDKDGTSVFSNETIPYQNGTSFTFDIKGTYGYSDSQAPAAKGTINVIDAKDAPDNLSTNATMLTAGVFVVPAAEKSYFDKHFSTLGYKVVDSTKMKDPSTGANSELYVYLQKTGKYETIVKRTGVKLGFLQGKLG
jgi:plastocyanin